MAKYSLMNNRLIFVLSFSLLIVLVSSAGVLAATALYDAWHNSGDSFTASGETFTITHYNIDDGSVILRANTQSYVIKEGNCRSSEIKKYCIPEIDRIGNDEVNTSNHVKFEGGRAYAGLHLVITALGPDVTITRAFSKTSPELNEEVTATITIKNAGDFSPDELNYAETLPDNVVITDYSSGLSKSGQTLSFSFKSLDPSAERSLTFKFRITDYVSVITKASWNYIYAGSRNYFNTSSTTFSIVKPYDFKLTLSPASVEVGSEIALAIQIDNKATSLINITSLEINIPSSISVQTMATELIKTSSKYYWNGSTEGGKYKLFSFLLKPSTDGDYVMASKIKVVDKDGKNFSESKNVSLKATFQDINPILSVKESIVSEGKNYRIAVSFENPNKNIVFKNVNAKISSELFEQMSTSLIEIAPGQAKTALVNDALIAPFLDDKKTFDINLTGIYYSSFGKQLNFSKKATLTVNPINETLSITQSADKSIVRPGENITLTVRVKNKLQEAYTVDVSDYYSHGLVIIGGKNTNSLSLGKLLEEQAYVYTLNIPQAFADANINITTTAVVSTKAYSSSKSMSVSVNQSAEQIAPIQNNTPIEPGAQPVAPEKKPGFLEKVVDAISDFFSRLLGKKK